MGAPLGELGSLLGCCALLLPQSLPFSPRCQLSDQVPYRKTPSLTMQPRAADPGPAAGRTSFTGRACAIKRPRARNRPCSVGRDLCCQRQLDRCFPWVSSLTAADRGIFELEAFVSVVSKLLGLRAFDFFLRILCTPRKSSGGSSRQAAEILAGTSSAADWPRFTIRDESEGIPPVARETDVYDSAADRFLL